MQLPPDCLNGILARRYKRFLADVILENGTTCTVHCPNSGSMRGCSEPGSPVIISRSDNPGRKYPWTLELVQANGVWIGINTSRTNALVREGLENGIITDFGVPREIRREVRVSQASRLDFLVETAQGRLYLEVKNCSLAENGTALFPDAVTVRGARHLEELARLRMHGFGAALLFCVQREDNDRFMPAASIDPHYAQTLVRVWRQGVQVVAYQARVTPEEIKIIRPLPCHFESESG